MKVIIIKKIGIIVIFLILALSLTCVSANEITNESQDNTLKVSEDIDNLKSESTQDQLSSAQLELDNDADKENINLGDEVTWIVTAQNFGPDTAKNVKVYDKLPSGLKYVKHTTTKGTFDPETGIWDIGDLKVSDGMVTLKITTVAESTGEKVNKAYLTSDNCDDIYEEWGDEMCRIIDNEVENESAGHNNYVLSSKERQQASYIQWLIMAVGLVVIFAATNYVVYQRRRRQLQLQLQQIQEVKEERPQSVRQAIESVEAAYFASDEYHELQHRIATGQTLKEEDWQGIENQLKKVYPGFGSQLRGLHAMSELEYQVCLLIKLRIAPSDIATVLARDVSTISTVRSRLFKKVFDKKGGAREWDEFVLSIGT